MNLASILIADDDQAIRTVLSQALSQQGFEVRSTGTAANLWRWIEAGEGDLVITDVVMPDGNGLDLLPKIRKIRPEMRVIIMSARNTLPTAVKASERGAFDYLAKPFDLNKLIETVRKALSGNKIPNEDIIGRYGEQDDEIMPFIGRSAPMQEIYRIMTRLMGTDLTVMITGELGTGKELIARALHDYSNRKHGPFITVSLSTIPKDLVNDEIFGLENKVGINDYVSKLYQAQNGTLFLDEIGDMPPDSQTRLLRLLQDGSFKDSEGRDPSRINVRIIASTHRDLRHLIRQGLFREDLFYRLNVVQMRIPPLRERKEDIPDLIHHFCQKANLDGLPVKSVNSDGMRELMGYSWPGNVRELKNLVKGFSALYSQEVIGPEIIRSELTNQTRASLIEESYANENLAESIERHLRAYFEAHQGTLPASGLYARIIRELERPLIAISLEVAKGNQLKTAQLLGLNRNTLRKKIRELDIPIVRSLK